MDSLPQILQRPRPVTLEFASPAEAVRWRFRAYWWMKTYGKAVRMSVKGRTLLIEDLPAKPQPLSVGHGSETFWKDHSCWKCREGTKPCRDWPGCEYPHARND